MLFSKKIEPRCSYCQRGNLLDETTVLCTKRGVSTPEQSCPTFRYDPLKRVPLRPVTPDFSALEEKNFSLT